MGTVARRIYLVLTIAVNDNEHNKQGQSGRAVGPAVPMALQIWTNNSLMFMAHAQCCVHNPAASCLRTLPFLLQWQLEPPGAPARAPRCSWLHCGAVWGPRQNLSWAWWDQVPSSSSAHLQQTAVAWERVQGIFVDPFVYTTKIFIC